jgi:DNA uptake protein ComE-like DNA-binding protein
MTRVWNTLLLLTTSSVLLFTQQETGVKQLQTEQAVKAAGTDAGDKLDVNSASSEELTNLKGIGEIYAAMIVRDRPYRERKDLIKRKVIPVAVYEDIKDEIVAKQNAGTHR